METVVDVASRHGNGPADGVHIGQREADVVELVQCLHVERPILLVVDVIRSCMVLPLSGHVDVRSTDPLLPTAASSSILHTKERKHIAFLHNIKWRAWLNAIG